MNGTMKKILAVALGSALTIGTIIVPPQTAKAADNKAVFTPIYLDGKNWQNSDDHWKSQAEFSLWYDASKDTATQLSTDYTISFKFYFPVGLIKHMKNKDGNALLDIGSSVSMWNANGEGGDENYLGRLQSINDVCVYYDPDAKVPFLNEESDTFKYSKLQKDGDYYVLTVTDLPTQTKMYNEDTDSYDKDVDTSVAGYESLDIVLNSDNIKDSSFIALDDVTLKKNGAVDLSENFDGDSVRPLYLYCEAIGASGDRTLTPSTLSTSILSVNKAQVSVKKGKKTTVKLTAPSVAKISYKTSNKKVATVTSKGVVKGVKKGKATITVSAAGVSKKVKVTVK